MLKRHSTRIIPEEVIKAYLNINEGKTDKPRRNSVLNPFNLQSNLLHYPEGGGTLSPNNNNDLKMTLSNTKSHKGANKRRRSTLKGIDGQNLLLSQFD